MEHSFKVQVAKVEHAKIITQFQCDMATETEGKKLDPVVTEKAIFGIMSTPKYGFYVVGTIEKDGKEEVVACSLVTYEFNIHFNKFTYWIQSVYVEPAHRKQGYFKKLYAFMREQAIKNGSPHLRLFAFHDNHRAHGVYKNLGMTMVKEKPLVESDFFFGKAKDVIDAANKTRTFEKCHFLTSLSQLPSKALFRSYQTSQTIDINDPNLPYSKALQEIIDRPECGKVFCIDDETGKVVAFVGIFYETSDWRGNLVYWVYDLFVREDAKTDNDELLQALYLGLHDAARKGGECICIRIITKEDDEKKLMEKLEKMGYEHSEHIIFEEDLQALPASKQ